MEKHKKSVEFAYALLIFLGSLGIHKFYLGKVIWGIIYLILGILGWITILTGSIAALASDSSSGGGLRIFGLICVIILGILIFYDLFTLPQQVKKVYEKAEDKIINELLSPQNE